MENGYSLADISAATNGSMGGGNSIFWIFALLALMNGGGFGWGNRGDYGQYATAASQQDILFSSKFSALDNKIDRIGNGIADATFALNNSIKDGNSVVAGRVVDEGRAMQAQLSDHNCMVQKNIDAVRYDMAQMFANSNAQHTAEIQQVKDLIKDNKIEALQGRINQLELQTAMCGVVRYPNTMAYDAGTSPFCGCNNGCCR